MPPPSMCQMLGSLGAAPRNYIRAIAGAVALGLSCRLNPYFTPQREPYTFSKSYNVTLSKSASLELYCITNEGKSI